MKAASDGTPGAVATATAWRKLKQAWRGEAAQLRRSFEQPERVQRDFLMRLVEANAGTLFGVDHGFARIRSYEDFAAEVPVAPYEAFRPYIDRLVAGSEGELTSGPVKFVELTGGSTGGSKVIPYTQAALDGYARALRPWLDDLLTRHPDVADGRIYFSLSPAGRSGGEKVGVVPLGSAEQFDYFGNAAPQLAELSIAPGALAALSDVEEWQFATCLHLLAASDLSLIWVWSPTYLSELLRAIQRMRDPLLDALAGGQCPTLPCPSPNPARAAYLASQIAVDGLNSGAIWPKLRVISCWMDASSAPFAVELRKSFPQVEFQAKGLMATEGATTLPFGLGSGSPLALESGFFEFMDVDGRIDCAWELAIGDVRRLILTNHAGLYRYDTEDMVEVVGFEAATPRLRFVGRAGRTSDLCGEKLSEHFVLNCLAEVLGADPPYAFLAPGALPSRHYQLWIESAEPTEAFAEVATELDAALHRNPQYAYARRLGQLDAISTFPTEHLHEKYRSWALAAGRMLSAMKAPALLSDLPDELVAALDMREK